MLNLTMMKLTLIILIFLCNWLLSSQSIIANEEPYLDQTVVREPDDSSYFKKAFQTATSAKEKSYKC